MNPPANPADVQVFQSDQAAFAVSEHGALVQIDNRLAGEVYQVREDSIRIETDRWELDSRRNPPVGQPEAMAGTDCMFRMPDGSEVTLLYRWRPDHPWLERRLVIRNGPEPLAVRRIELGNTVFADPPRECVDYDTFWHCPTVTFLRWPRGGLFAGIENPFFATRREGGLLAQSFAPGLVLKPGETYESEPQFIGVYRHSGRFVEDRPPRTVLGQRPRFGNPCGHIPLDRAEIRAMQRFAADYLDVPTRQFHFILYNFFYPLPRMPRVGSPEEALHLKMIDTFRELGGDLAILNPMFAYRKPEGRPDAFWDLAPEGTGAGTILRRAQARGIGGGFYTGCAFHGTEGNAAALPFAPERTEWKKTDAQGHAAAENCMACDAYADWFFAVQRNTIARYGLRVWDWDPGPGNGCFCHNPAHGHLPAQGGYKGWRNATAMMRRLREAFPCLYLQAFYGRKEYGLWGFKHFDQHESYWEVSQAFAASMHPELHADRVNADQIRHQAYWNQAFRFHPPQLSHSMTHRQQEGCWDPRLSKTWDALGWRYSFMSTLAACGSVLVTIMPEDLALAPGMRAFYAKWLAWAREHYDYVPYSIPFGEQLRPGCVDGWARIKGDRGFVFLCNPNPRPARIAFGLDDDIGLAATSGGFALTELYPVDRRPRGVFAAGARVSLVVPADEVVLLELAPAASAAPVPVAPGSPPLLPRALDAWATPDGGRFAFPRHAAAERITVETAFTADPRIRALLAAARPPNLAEIEPLIPEWKKQYPDNFAWARPDRLWLVIPFADADRVGSVGLRLNDADLPAECHVIGNRKIVYYADITDAVKWGGINRLGLTLTDLGANQFMGPHLDYPPADAAAEALAAETAPVIYDGRPLEPDPPPRVPAGPDDPRRMPAVTSLTMEPSFLREGRETRVAAKVNLPPEDVAGVFLAGPHWADNAMGYDATARCWVTEVRPGPRWGLIMDVPRYYAWAVAKNGLVSARVAVDVTWRYAD